ncbi:MAG TPA: GNAT family N-acetyltransferase [Candidatus Limnocylindria bacterium]|nr:GNAT family N-acetyltransferase [Candidatus Limnocylindria bacterium]
MIVRLADARRDAASVAAIYRPAVEESLASFEEVAPDAAAMRERIASTLERTPWLVVEQDARVLGYAYAGPHRDRAGYRWAVNISVYVDASFHRRGIGRLLYDELLELLRRQRFVNAYAGITLPNPASVALHEAIGMRRVGVYERVGWKAGAWHDVAWYQLRLAEPAGVPPEPLPLPVLRPMSANTTNPHRLQAISAAGERRPDSGAPARAIPRPKPD